MSGTVGYAVVDTETTGILPGFKHRIAEIAVIQLDADGTVTSQWSTLVNPDRDLGPQAIHGIGAAEVRRAPRFEQVAGDVIEQVRGRVVVAHNWAFDAMHLHAEFERVGITSPFDGSAGLCTMRAAALALPGSGRALIDCCAAVGLTDLRWHTAHDDALAAAALLKYLLTHNPTAVRIMPKHLQAARWAWPSLPCNVAAPVHRTAVGHVEPHFLARLVERLPHDEEPVVDAYFAMLDDALLDRQISASEADALIDLAYRLGLHRAQALAVHHSYLSDLARSAWADGVITADERRDLGTVAILLGLDPSIVDRLLDEERPDAPGAGAFSGSVTPGGLTFRPGDKIVLTGAMRFDRADIIHRATSAGLRVTTGVSKQTRVLVAADPDSLSGKAKKARMLGVPVVSEDAFLSVLEAMTAAA